MYQKNLKGWLKHIDFILLDFLVIQISFLVAFGLRHGMSQMDVGLYKNTAVCLGMIDLVVVFFNDSYKGILKRDYIKELKETIKHVTYVNGLFLLYLFAVQNGNRFSRIVFFMMWGIELGCIWFTRSFWKQYLISKKRGQIKRSIIVITTEENVETCIGSLTAKAYDDFKITGLCVIDRDLKGKMIGEIPVVANKREIVDYIKRNWVDEVFIWLPEDISSADAIMDGCNEMGVTVHLALAHCPFMESGHQLVEHMGEYTVLTSSIHIATNRQSFLKRLLDIIGGFVGSVITIFLIFLIGPIIYIQSPGPIFFSQERIGKNGKKFKIYKFRSMYMDAEERKKDLMGQNRVKDGMMFKVENDPRIIHRKNGKKGIGDFIRKTSLDEFPQFVNVLKGEMSLVGTRPPTPDEWEKYELHHRARLAIKPGITGLWQVSGRSDITDFEEVVKLDTEYITGWNLGKDIKILFQTVRVVLGIKGSM